MTGPQSFEPGQVAALDQIAARADDQLDGEVAWMREHLDAMGLPAGTTAIALYLLEHGSVESLAMSYAWALRRLARGGAR